MKPIKQHITLALTLLMAYMPIHNVMHYVWVDHEHHCNHHQDTTDDILTTYESDHNCSDFLFKVSSYTYTFEVSIDEAQELIYSNIFKKSTFIFSTRHHLINALRGPP